MTDTDTPGSSDSPPPSVPGEQRRLAHPPSDRYLVADPVVGDGDPSGADRSASVARGIAIAITLALVGAVAIVVLGGGATVTNGLIVVAGAIGFGVALALQLGAGGHLPPGRRIGLAVALTVASVALGQVGIWRYALAEGGVLPLIDYLGEVFGPLVIVELVVGAVVAWVVAR